LCIRERRRGAPTLTSLADKTNKGKAVSRLWRENHHTEIGGAPNDSVAVRLGSGDASSPDGASDAPSPCFHSPFGFG